MNPFTLGKCLLVPFSIMSAVTMGCVSFEPVLLSQVEHFDDRPVIAILPVIFDRTITSLPTLQTAEQPHSPEEETVQVQESVQEIQQTARWLLMSRLATGGGFCFVPPDEVDALREELHMNDGELPTAVQLARFRDRLGVDPVVAVNILDCGKIRWQWLAAGMFADISWETVVIGLATAWNPGIILGNVGFELLTSTPLWLAGAICSDSPCDPCASKHEPMRLAKATPSGRPWRSLPRPRAH